MTKILNTLILTVFFGVFFFSCSTSTPISSAPSLHSHFSYEEIKNSNAIIIDVREKEEVEQGMIKGAYWLPLSKMKKNNKEVTNKLKELTSTNTAYIYCRSGKRAGEFIELLTDKDISTFNLGGFEALKKMNFPSEKIETQN